MRLKKLATALCPTALFILGVSSMGGCAEDRTTLFINSVTLFPPGASCEVDSSLAGEVLGHGSYDPGAGAPYIAYLVLGNGIQPLGDNDTLRPETSRIVLEGAEITVEATSDGASSFDPFTTKFTGTIQPNDSEEPGVLALPVPLIPAGASIAPGEYVLNIVVYGETLGGLDVESSPFAFPLTIEPEGTLTFCDDPSLAPEGAFHPCGPYAQDGYLFPCQSKPTAACVDYCGL